MTEKKRLSKITFDILKVEKKEKDMQIQNTESSNK